MIVLIVIMETTVVIGIFTFLVVFSVLTIYCASGVIRKVWIKLYPQQTIWSVSGQMNHENSTDNQRWPTHNSNVSVDSFILTESARMQQKDRVPPPPYSEIELPSYEQAVCMTAPKSNTPAVHAASSSRTNQDPSPS
ncbi:uncharacterized protein LOC116182140 isoform X2 [Photinus pyralis]|uniref:uncharacterized protein LOC116182140 isoform X2 n=1 Tax=Photinus pyralis TaxID=7054 RepID=UPI001266FB61|nr:uncharacterized protein LOC116182140 isoform X2 [Photinus pyralis]